MSDKETLRDRIECQQLELEELYEKIDRMQDEWTSPEERKELKDEIARLKAELAAAKKWNASA